MESNEAALFAIGRIEASSKDATTEVETSIATATGFLYRTDENRVFLITNRHVVFEKESDYYPDNIVFYAHKDRFELNTVQQIKLRLWTDDGKHTWQSSKRNPEADVVALEIPHNELDGCYVKYFTKSDILDHQSSLPGRDIPLGLQSLIMGYPLDFYDEENHFPMARFASVATWPMLNFQRMPCFLIDANLHEGMSGGPVMSYPGSLLRSNKHIHTSIAPNQNIYLLGIFSDEWGRPEDRLGLNTVWHANIIREICKD